MNPRIYVASLSDYNAGRLLGVWIDAVPCEEEMADQVYEMLRRSRELVAEEYAIHDYEGFPCELGEYTPLSEVAAICELLEQGEAGAAALSHACGDLDYARELIEQFIGVYESEEDFAEELVEMGVWGELSPFLRDHLDMASLAMDLFINDYTSVDTDEGVAVFRSY